MNVEDVKEKLHRTIWGEHSLTAGEMICFAIGALLFYKPFLGKWSKWAGLAIIFIGMAIF